MTSTQSSVEVVTRDHLVTGHCPVLDRYARLLDLLRNPDMTVVELADVQIRSVLQPAVVTTADTLFLKKERILFGWPLQAAESDKGDLGESGDFLEKRVYAVKVFLPPYRISGNVSLPEGAELQIAFPNLLRGFLAMSATTVAHEGDGPAWEKEFLALNGQLGEIIAYGPGRPSQGVAPAA